MKRLVSLFLVMNTFAPSLLADAQPPTGDYKKVVDSMLALEAANPELVHVFSIGQNDSGIELYAMRISLTPTEVDHGKIGQLIVATHHGNEKGAAVLAVKIADDLLQRYNKVSVMETVLADTEWTILPVLNTPGCNINRREELGVDSNRDYPGPCISTAGGELGSIRTLMDYLETRVFVGTITVHGYVGSMTYPWGVATTEVRTRDHEAFRSAAAKAAAINHYQYGTSTDIVYPADGTYEDYVYWKYGMWSLLIELRNGNPNDIMLTSQAAIEFFHQINSSPSNQHDMTGRCRKGLEYLDRHDE